MSNNLESIIPQLIRKEYSVKKCVDVGGNVLSLEVFSPAIMMDFREAKLRELFPDLKIYGLKNTETIYIEKR